jgi:hypothetical protein
MSMVTVNQVPSCLFYHGISISSTVLKNHSGEDQADDTLLRHGIVQRGRIVRQKGH